MKILVTGAAGFVGSRLSKALLARGDSVVGLDNFDPYYDVSHKRRHLGDIRDHPNFALATVDLRDAAAVRGVFESHQPTAVAHLAGMAAVRFSIQHPLIYGEANIQGTMHLLDAARHHGNPNCVLASTGSVYGISTPVPFVETAAADQPLAPYPASKRAMELMAHAFHHLYQTPTTVVRFFNVYGPHGRPDMMPWQWTLNILNNVPLTLYNAGRIKRDWTYIDDIVGGMIAALDRPFKTFEIINLGCSQPVENLEFIDILERLLGRKAIRVDTPTPASEPMITYADISKARRLLGYEPRIDVAEGLARFVAWMRDEKIITG